MTRKYERANFEAALYGLKTAKPKPKATLTVAEFVREHCAELDRQVSRLGAEQVCEILATQQISAKPDRLKELLRQHRAKAGGKSKTARGVSDSESVVTPITPPSPADEAPERQPATIGQRLFGGAVS